MRERIKDDSKVWGPNDWKNSAAFNSNSNKKSEMRKEQIWRGREDQEFSLGYPEFEIRLSQGVIKTQPDRKSQTSGESLGWR